METTNKGSENSRADCRLVTEENFIIFSEESITEYNNIRKDIFMLDGSDKTIKCSKFLNGEFEFSRLGTKTDYENAIITILEKYPERGELIGF